MNLRHLLIIILTTLFISNRAFAGPKVLLGKPVGPVSNSQLSELATNNYRTASGPGIDSESVIRAFDFEDALDMMGLNSNCSERNCQIKIADALNAKYLFLSEVSGGKGNFKVRISVIDIASESSKKRFTANADSFGELINESAKSIADAMEYIGYDRPEPAVKTITDSEEETNPEDVFELNGDTTETIEEKKEETVVVQPSNSQPKPKKRRKKSAKRTLKIVGMAVIAVSAASLTYSVYSYDNFFKLKDKDQADLQFRYNNISFYTGVGSAALGAFLYYKGSF